MVSNKDRFLIGHLTKTEGNKVSKLQKAIDTPQKKQTPKTQEKATEPVTEKPTEISPENIVNLKDLPK